MTHKKGKGMTINKAIRLAIATVRMYPYGARSYIVEQYCPDRHAWIESAQMPFHVARACMTEKRHTVALIALGWSDRDAESAAYYCAGSLRDRVKASLVGAKYKKQPIDFSAYHRATWRNGEMPKNKIDDTVVNYDQINHAYCIDADDQDVFVNWVADLWQSDNDYWDEDETAEDYLDRRGIAIYWP